MAREKRWRDPFEERDFEREHASVTGPEKDTRSDHQRAAAQQDTRPSKDDHISKKPKHEADADADADSHDKQTHSPPQCADCERLQTTGLAKDKKYLTVQKELYELKEALNSKDATFLKTKHKLWADDAASKAALAEVETGRQELKVKLATKNLFINQLQRENNELRSEVRALEAELARGRVDVLRKSEVETRTEINTVRVCMPAHPSSPQPPPTTTLRAKSPARRADVDIQPRRFYPRGTGRLSPATYGSNASWDLGLCEAHFNSPHECKHGKACEYRHRALAGFERELIERSGTVGRGFLERCAAMTMDKEG